MTDATTHVASVGDVITNWIYEAQLVLAITGNVNALAFRLLSIKRTIKDRIEAQVVITVIQGSSWARAYGAVHLWIFSPCKASAASKATESIYRRNAISMSVIYLRLHTDRAQAGRKVRWRIEQWRNKSAVSKTQLTYRQRVTRAMDVKKGFIAPRSRLMGCGWVQVVKACQSTINLPTRGQLRLALIHYNAHLQHYKLSCTKTSYVGC